MKEFLIVLTTGEKFHVKGSSLKTDSGLIFIDDEQENSVAILPNVAFIAEVTALSDSTKKGRPNLGLRYV